MDVVDAAKAVEANPGSAAARNDLGIALGMAGRHAEAAAAFAKAVESEPRLAAAHGNLGHALRTLERYADAAASYRRALAIDPALAEIHASLGNVLRTLGEVGESSAEIEEAIRLAPGVARYYYYLTDSKRFAAGDAHLAAMERLAQNAGALRDDERIFLNFALGSAYADIGRHEDAFRHLAEGNRLKRASIRYDESAVLGLLARVERVFTADLMQARAGEGDASAAPIFVFGMPRSGTTLVEQMLASDPRVTALGEIVAMRDAVNDVAGGEGRPRYPEVAETVDGEALRGIAGGYMRRLHALAPDAERIVDKTLGNFAYAGMIHLALPKARMIHVERNAADACLSCFSKLFPSEFRYSYDLGELGRYYRAYAQLMEHWRRVLPEGAMLDVRYEKLVADFEREARRIVAFCGLEWDAACLRFFEGKRAVRTSSASQVRQPVYASAVGRARAYEGLLGPLLVALGGARP